MPRSRSAVFLGLVLVALAARPIAAQDANHWTDQFGNRARLLSGAVVGSAGDLSAIYYNPGALSKSERPEIAISADAIEYVTTTVRDGLAPNRSVSSSRFSWLPSFFGGYLRFNRLGKSRLAYCFLTRRDLEARIEERGALAGSAIDPGSDPGDLALGFHQRITEYWLGVTWSRQVGSRLGLGISNFVAVRNQRSSTQAVLQGGGPGSFGVLAVTGRNFNYEHWGLLWKLGVSVPLENWSFGVNLTTPAVRIAGSGATSVDQSYFIQRADSTTERDIGTLHDDDVKARFRSPLSVAAGISRRFGRGHLYATVEWFDAVRSMTILDTQPGTSEQGEVLTNDITYALRSVVNAAVGAEFEAHETVHGFASFCTDRSASEPQGSNSTYSSYNVYRVAAGAIVKALRADVTIGAVYAWGHDDLERSVLPWLGSGATSNLANASPSVTHRSYTFVFGFNFPFMSSPESATP